MAMKLKMTVSQRMSCSPKSLRAFIWNGSSIYDLGDLTFSIQEPIYVKNVSQLNSNLSLAMWTSNTLGSGLETFNEGDIFQLQVLPKFDAKRFGQIHVSLKQQMDSLSSSSSE
jgi:hypothetical protein